MKRVAGIATLAVAWIAACGGPSERHCAAESAWSGSCALKGITKLREAEFPVPHVVLELVYQPEENASSPGFTPPAVREEVKILAAQELELRTHVEQKAARVQCQMAAPAPGSCQPGPVSLAIPPFTPTGATAANEVKGCAQIESQATQDQLPAMTAGATPITEVFSFGESSAELGAESAQAANRVAQRLVETPSIECVAVVGLVSPGEPPGLAAERARKVRELLMTAGVEGARLTIISVTQQVYGAGSEAPPPDPAKRRAVLRVLLQRR